MFRFKYLFKYLKINLNIQKRFITDTGVLKLIKQSTKVSRTSTYNSSTSELISLIKDKNYKEATNFINKHNIDINSHDYGENTPLTDTAYRNDKEGLKFVLGTKGINPHASCGCPFHKTALHYAVENSHNEIVELLLKSGAKPNILDSRHYSPLDLARTDKIKKLLIEYGGIQGKQIPSNQYQVLNLPKANCSHKLHKELK